MTDDLEPQIRAWSEDIDDPIPIDDVRLHQRRKTSWASDARRGPVVLAAAAVLLLVAGLVAVLATTGSSSSLETVADSADDEASTAPETSTAPTSAATETPDETTTTTTTAATTTSSTTPAAPARVGTVSEIVDPPDGENCQGLRSQTVWATTGTPDEIAAAAGGRADYVETVTNEGTETCSMIFERCPGPGVLFTAEGEPAPRTGPACPMIRHAPVDLAPGESRQDVFTAELFTKPGAYELRVPQHDGRVASLPIRLEPQIPACDPGTLTVDQQPDEAGVSRNDTTSAYISIAAVQRSCTVRITDTRLTLRPEGDPAAAERTFIDGAQRWYTTDADRTVAYATFGPIDLPPGEYEGVIVLHLENGEALRKPARLIVY
ncbi:MAG TPA: hypothetical protein VMN58_07245 [Acidimicrobiales bacterium]|nr:hypothetical protein [Acidimicrobiales bacterium]